MATAQFNRYRLNDGAAPRAFYVDARGGNSSTDRLTIADLTAPRNQIRHRDQNADGSAAAENTYTINPFGTGNYEGLPWSLGSSSSTVTCMNVLGNFSTGFGGFYTPGSSNADLAANRNFIFISDNPYRTANTGAVFLDFTGGTLDSGQFVVPDSLGWDEFHSFTTPFSFDKTDLYVGHPGLNIKSSGGALTGSARSDNSFDADGFPNHGHFLLTSNTIIHVDSDARINWHTDFLPNYTAGLEAGARNHVILQNNNALTQLRLTMTGGPNQGSPEVDAHFDSFTGRGKFRSSYIVEWRLGPLVSVRDVLCYGDYLDIRFLGDWAVPTAGGFHAIEGIKLAGTGSTLEQPFNFPTDEVNPAVMPISISTGTVNASTAQGYFLLGLRSADSSTSRQVNMPFYNLEGIDIQSRTAIFAQQTSGIGGLINCSRVVTPVFPVSDARTLAGIHGASVHWKYRKLDHTLTGSGSEPAYTVDNTTVSTALQYADKNGRISYVRPNQNSGDSDIGIVAERFGRAGTTTTGLTLVDGVYARLLDDGLRTWYRRDTDHTLSVRFPGKKFIRNDVDIPAASDGNTDIFTLNGITLEDENLLSTTIHIYDSEVTNNALHFHTVPPGSFAPSHDRFHAFVDEEFLGTETDTGAVIFAVANNGTGTIIIEAGNAGKALRLVTYDKPNRFISSNDFFDMLYFHEYERDLEAQFSVDELDPKTLVLDPAIDVRLFDDIPATFDTVSLPNSADTDGVYEGVFPGTSGRRTYLMQATDLSGPLTRGDKVDKIVFGSTNSIFQSGNRQVQFDIEGGRDGGQSLYHVNDPSRGSASELQAAAAFRNCTVGSSTNRFRLEPQIGSQDLFVVFYDLTGNSYIDVAIPTGTGRLFIINRSSFSLDITYSGPDAANAATRVGIVHALNVTVPSYNETDHNWRISIFDDSDEAGLLVTFTHDYAAAGASLDASIFSHLNNDTDGYIVETLDWLSRSSDPVRFVFSAPGYNDFYFRGPPTGTIQLNALPLTYRNSSTVPNTLQVVSTDTDNVTFGDRSLGYNTTGIDAGKAVFGITGAHSSNATVTRQVFNNFAVESLRTTTAYQRVIARSLGSAVNSINSSSGNHARIDGNYILLVPGETRGQFIGYIENLSDSEQLNGATTVGGNTYDLFIGANDEGITRESFVEELSAQGVSAQNMRNLATFGGVYVDANGNKIYSPDYS